MRLFLPFARPLAVVGMGLMAMRADASASLGELFSATPVPPADVTIAAGWVQNGAIVAPDYLGFQARLKAEKEAIAAAQAQAAARTAVPADQDTAAVQTAVNAFRVYSADNSGDKEPTTLLAKREAWLLGRFSKIVVSDPRIKQQQSAAELESYQSLFKDWKSKRGAAVTRADGQLAAAGDPGAVRSGANLQAIAQYRTAVLKEIEALLSITEQAVNRAAVTQAAIKSVP